MPVSWHVGEPAEQELMPDWHTFPPGLHRTPSAHGAQLPLPSQSWPLPQAVPAGAFFATHAATPDAQETVPT